MACSCEIKFLSSPPSLSLFYIQEDTENKIVAVKTMLVILVLSSLTQLALWTVAHCQKLVVYNHRPHVL